ncbi:MAG: TonB-dependent receptor [Kordiimonadaceae bacterium]|nr:TonB-dependent receptor [Kordiimonadaceae bacterium]
MTSGHFLTYSPMIKKSFNRGALTLIAFSSLIAGSTMAQEAEDSATVTYNEDYFLPYKPVTLHDMLRSVPGTAALLARADEELAGRRTRGFGSEGDQILIDGKRIAGKTNSLGLQLKRIQATSVSRIELIRGTKAGLDVQSEGLIINVIMKATASKSSTVWTVGTEYVEEGKVNPLAKVTHTGEAGRLKYLVGVDFALEETRKKFNDTFFNASGIQFEDNSLTNNHNRHKLFLNSSTEYTAENGDIFRLNGQLEFDDQDTLETDNQQLLLTNDRNLVVRDQTHKPLHWEVGGDYQHQFEKLGLSKTLFVFNRGKHDIDTAFSGALNGAALAGTGENLYQIRHGEMILRSSLTNTFAQKHTVEIGGEAAINDFDTANTNYRADGTVNLSTLSDQDAREVRYEAFASHNYSISSNISLQSSVNAEWSKITQTNNLVTINQDFSRNFFYLKPRLNLRYDIDAQNQIRATAERKISQLNFGDFGNKFDAEDNEVDAGNAELRPEDRLEFSIAFENRFPEDQGSISIKAFYNKIRDHIAKIPKPDPINNPTNNPQLATESLPGNIGDAKEYGVEINGNLRLKVISLPNAILTGKYILRETEAFDPFLQMNRPIIYKQKHEWLVNFQHDLVQSGTSYGFNITNKAPVSGLTGTSIGFRTDATEQWEQTIEPKASLYIEQKIVNEMKIRFDMDNIFNAKSAYHKTKYIGNISMDVVNYDEFRKASQQRVYRLSLQGTF